MQEVPLFGALQVYRERGYYLRRLEQFEKAAVAFDEAFRNCQDDIRLLLGRSQVCADAGMPQEAFEAADLALKLEPNNMNAIKMQARAMYSMADFEKSVVMNARGRRIRSQPPYFNDGFIQGMETLQDCIGVKAGKVLQNNLAIIKQNKRLLRGQIEPCVEHHKCRIPKQEVKTRLTQMEEREHELLRKVMSMKYLGPMAADKFFLLDLLVDPRLKCANVEKSKELADTVEEAINKLLETQEMLRTQRPYYSIQNSEKSQSRYLTNYRQVCLEQERNVGLKYAERCLKEVLKCLEQRRIKEMMTKAARMQVFLSSKTPRTLPEKNEFIDKLYKAVGDGYLSQYRVSYESEKQNRQRIIFLMGLLRTPKSYDSVIANYSCNVAGAGDPLEKMINDLDVCENAWMKCSLNYDIATTVLYSQKNYALAKIYAKRCQKQAVELDSVVWWLNACFVLMSGEMQQGNGHEVKLNIEEAADWIKRLHTLDASTQINAFMTNVLQILSETNLYEHNADKLRKKQILSILDEQTKEHTQVLFKRMAAIPAGRRFKVAAEMCVPLQMTCERRRHRQPGITVVPGAPLMLTRLPKSEPKGYQDFKF